MLVANKTKKYSLVNAKIGMSLCLMKYSKMCSGQEIKLCTQFSNMGLVKQSKVIPSRKW